MADVSFSLPTELQRHVDARVAAEGLTDGADYFRALVRRDQEDYEQDVRRVRQLIEDGIASGLLDEDAEHVLAAIIAEDPDLRG